MKNIKLKSIVDFISYQLDDWQNEDNGAWLQSYDDCADRQTLADLIAYDETRFYSMLSDNFQGFDELTDSNKQDFIDYLLDWGDWRAVFIHPFDTERESVSLYFGAIGEHETQIEGLEKYSKLIQARFPEITISGDCIYYYNDGGIAFELQGEYKEIMGDFIESNNQHNIQHFLSDARGVYIPQDFIDSIDLDDWHGITKEDADILAAGPDQEAYWETWDCVLNNASYKDKKGITWRLWQEGDLWLVTDNYIFED